MHLMEVGRQRLDLRPKGLRGTEGRRKLRRVALSTPWTDDLVDRSLDNDRLDRRDLDDLVAFHHAVLGRAQVVSTPVTVLDFGFNRDIGFGRRASGAGMAFFGTALAWTVGGRLPVRLVSLDWALF